jgi:hypothetical protein
MDLPSRIYQAVLQQILTQQAAAVLVVVSDSYYHD